MRIDNVETNIGSLFEMLCSKRKQRGEQKLRGGGEARKGFPRASAQADGDEAFHVGDREGSRSLESPRTGSLCVWWGWGALMGTEM